MIQSFHCWNKKKKLTIATGIAKPVIALNRFFGRSARFQVKQPALTGPELPVCPGRSIGHYTLNLEELFRVVFVCPDNGEAEAPGALDERRVDDVALQLCRVSREDVRKAAVVVIVACRVAHNTSR